MRHGARRRCEHQHSNLVPNETLLGFPGAALEALMVALEALSTKAMARSRAKIACQHVQQKLETP